MSDHRIVPVDRGIPGASSPTTSGKGTLTLAALSDGADL